MSDAMDPRHEAVMIRYISQYALREAVVNLLPDPRSGVTVVRFGVRG